MNCKDFFVIRHSWCKNPLKVFGLHEYRPISRFEASAVKVMRPILTREFSFQFILLSLLHCDVDHGVKVGILEDESLKWYLLHVCHPGIMVQFLSFERRYSFLNLTLFLDVMTQGWRCCRCCFSRSPRSTRIVKATVSRCTLEDSSSFEHCSNLVSLARAIPQKAVNIRNTDYRIFLSFRATMNRNSQFTICQSSYKTFRIFQWWYLLEDDFEFILATFHWWQPSTTFFMLAPILFKNFHTWCCSCEHSVGRSCTMSTLDTVLSNILWECTRTFGCGGCPSMQQNGLALSFVFMCLLYDLLSFLFHCRFLHLESTLLGMKDFWIHSSRFLEACVSERPPESSEPYVTLDSSKFRWTEPHSEFILLPSQVHTWEYLVLSRILRVYLKNFRLTDALCRETRNKLGDELFLEIFHKNEFVCKLWKGVQNSVLSLQY